MEPDLQIPLLLQLLQKSSFSTSTRQCIRTCIPFELFTIVHVYCSRNFEALYLQSYIQMNPALIDPPRTEFRLQQMQIHSPFSLFSLISYVGNNQIPPITKKFHSPLKSVRAGFNCRCKHLLTGKNVNSRKHEMVDVQSIVYVSKSQRKKNMDIAFPFYVCSWKSPDQ